MPAIVQQALAAASDQPGYPQTAGSQRLREAIRDYLGRRCGAARAHDPATLGVLPTIGSKELVAFLPTLLGLGPGDMVVIPRVCYPTYEVGARLAGAQVVRADDPAELDPAEAGAVRLVWVNSPSNPDGRVLSAADLTRILAWTRRHGAVLTSDECYLELGWETEPASVLSVDTSYGGVLAVHSLSKRSNLAGYRAGFISGDPAIVAELLAVRKHAGMIVPAPVQAAMVAALGDQAHVDEQRERYRRRRDTLRRALIAAGFAIDNSMAGLYLWATRGEADWATLDYLADRGILVAPGTFYGPAGERHVRVALTATDDRIAAAADRLRA